MWNVMFNIFFFLKIGTWLNINCMNEHVSDRGSSYYWFKKKNLTEIFFFIYLIPFISDCNGTYYSSYGTIMSPNFPNNYPLNVKCTYTIQSPLLLPVTLIFTSFEVEPGTSVSSCYDFVRVSMLFCRCITPYYSHYGFAN